MSTGLNISLTSISTTSPSRTMPIYMSVSVLILTKLLPITPPSTPTLDCFPAVRDNVPRTYAQAPRDPVWGDAARSEFNTILVETKSMVRMDPTLAKQHIHAGAEVLHMHPVYEKNKKKANLFAKFV